MHYLHKKSTLDKGCFSVAIIRGLVVPPGIEPGTHGFSVRCSTN